MKKSNKDKKFTLEELSGGTKDEWYMVTTVYDSKVSKKNPTTFLYDKETNELVTYELLPGGGKKEIKRVSAKGTLI